MDYLSKILILLSVAIWANTALACSNANLQTRENSPFQRIPVYDQNGLGSCYAYAASQLIDYHRLSRGYGNQNGLTHPIWTALQAKKRAEESTIESGNARNAVLAVARNGTCRESEVQRILNDYKGEGSLTDAQFMSLVENISDSWDSSRFSTIGEVFNEALENSDAKNVCFDHRYVRDRIFEPFRLDSGKFRKVLGTEFLDNILSSCRGNNYYRPNLESVRSNCQHCSDSEIDSLIKNKLNRGQPLIVNYCARVLGDKNYRGIDSSRNDFIVIKNRSSRILLEEDLDESKIDPNKKDKMTKGCGKHSSMVVGSRNHGGKCQYLLRNTWGSTTYEQHPNCLCEVAKGRYENCNHGDGTPNVVGCWVDAEALTPNIFETVHF